MRERRHLNLNGQGSSEKSEKTPPVVPDHLIDDDLTDTDVDLNHPKPTSYTIPENEDDTSNSPLDSWFDTPDDPLEYTPPVTHPQPSTTPNHMDNPAHQPHIAANETRDERKTEQGVADTEHRNKPGASIPLWLACIIGGILLLLMSAILLMNRSGKSDAQTNPTPVVVTQTVNGTTPPAPPPVTVTEPAPPPVTVTTTATSTVTVTEPAQTVTTTPSAEPSTTTMTETVQPTNPTSAPSR